MNQEFAGFKLEPYEIIDEKALYEIYKEVVDTGNQFPFDCSSIEEFQRQFLNPQNRVYVCRGPTSEIVGGFYIRSNFPGRSKHIANAGYMLHSAYRNRGLGTWIVKNSLALAKSLGFHAMQFNLVLSQNLAANALYRKLGFEVIGTIPHAVKNPDGSYQDGYIMFQKLGENS